MSDIKEQRCLKSIQITSEHLAIHLKLGAPIINVQYNPQTGVIEFIVWDESNPCAEAGLPKQLYYRNQ